jgi:hypothetical protein
MKIGFNIPLLILVFVVANLAAFFSYLISDVRGGFPDYENYLHHYYLISHNIPAVTMETSFLFITSFFIGFGNVGFIFLLSFYFVCAFTIKFYYIYTRSTAFILSYILYISYYFALHELIQIRAGLSIAFFIVFIFAVIDNQKLKALVGLSLSVFFHIQSLLILPFYLYSKFVFYSKIRLVSSICISLVLGFIITNYLHLFVDVLSVFLPSKAANLILVYSATSGDTNVFTHHTILFMLVITTYCVFFKLQELNKTEMWLLCSISFSLCCMFLFKNFNEFAWRFFDMFSVASIFLLPLWINRFKQKLYPLVIIVIYCGINFYMSFKTLTSSSIIIL